MGLGLQDKQHYDATTACTLYDLHNYDLALVEIERDNTLTNMNLVWHNITTI